MNHWVKLPFIYVGMLVYIAVPYTHNTITCICEITDIRAKVVEVTLIQDRTSMWVNYDQIFIKMNDVTARGLVRLASPLHCLIQGMYP